VRRIILTCVVAVAIARAAGGADLNALVAKVAADAIKQFEKEQLKSDDFAITVIDLRDPANLKSGSYRGDAGIYPASVVKLFYLAAAHRWMEDGKLKDSDELRRAMSDMIVKSTNDATNWILEAVTDTGNGPLLPDDEMKAWAERRNSINRHFQSMGYSGINVCQKTYNEGPYGREKLFLENNRNRLTTDATARLLSEIVLGKSVSAERSRQMMELLKRDMSSASRGNDDQATGFTAIAMPRDAKLWSKAGWTSTARHDAAYFELPDGRKLVTVIFTTGHARQREILPAMVSKILEATQPEH
jgi:beta-lactamase class A